MSQIALVDIDDTLADTQSKMLEYINSKFSRKYAAYEITREFREGNVPEYELGVEEFLMQPALIYEISAYDNALDALKKLKRRGYEVHVASSRKENLHDVTKKWLTTHGFIGFVDVLHSRHSRQKGHEFKHSIAKRINPAIAFDDTLDVAKIFASEGINTYLIDKPWNQSTDLPPKLTRVTNFSTAVKEVLMKGGDT